MLNFKTFLENLEHSKNDVHKIVQYSEKLLGIVKPNVELEDWVKAKLTHTEDYLNTVLDYLKYYKQQNEDNNKMAMGDLRSIHEKAKEIEKILDKEKELKDWIKSKLNLAGEYMDDVFHHLDYNKKEGFVNQSMPDPENERSPKASEYSADPHMSINDLPPTPFSRRQENLKYKTKMKKKADQLKNN